MIKKFLINCGIQINSYSIRHTDCDLNVDYFHIIDTPEKAYFLGFLFADGNIFDNSLSLEIHHRDIEILEKFKKELNTSNKISHRVRENTDMNCLRVCSRMITKDLEKYNIVPNKTKEICHLPNNIPQKFLRDYLRGLLDGDGWLTVDNNGRLHVGYVTNYESTALDFQRYCLSLIKCKNAPKITIKDKKNSGYVSQFFSQEQVKQLVTALYKDSTIYLSRKYEKAKDFFINDEDIV